jgi:hypothetical protein
MEYEKSGITSEDVMRYAGLVKDPSTVTVMGSENLGGGVETGSTGERDVHSDATSEKHSPPPYSEGRREDSSMMVPDLKPTTENSYGGGLYGSDSSPSYTSPKGSGHASDFQSAEGLESDMPDKGRIRSPPSSGNRGTDITGIPYIQ